MTYVLLQRNRLKPLSMADLNIDTSDFWRNQSGFVNPRDREIARAFCEWHSAISEVKGIESGMRFVYKHAVDDCKVLSDSLYMETRLCARKLIMERIKTLRDKQFFILKVPGVLNIPSQ
jgi:hypothetical protein